MTEFVLDASVALSWFIDHPVAPYASRVRQQLLNANKAIVPGLWKFEIANGFVVAERRGLLSAADTTRALQNIEVGLGQSIQSSPVPMLVGRIVATARHFGLTGYDASYLQLAQELHVPLATLDRRLREAAMQAQVPLLA